MFSSVLVQKIGVADDEDAVNEEYPSIIAMCVRLSLRIDQGHCSFPGYHGFAFLE